MLSKCDLVGDCVSIVGACITNSNIWISTSLGLTNLEGVGRTVNRNETIEWRNECCSAVRLSHSTGCYWANRPWHVAWCSSLGVTKSFHESPYNSSSSRYVIGIIFGWHCGGSQCYTIWLLSNGPVIMSNEWSSSVQALNAHYINISSIDVLLGCNFASNCIDDEIGSCVIGTATSELQRARVDESAMIFKWICEESSWVGCFWNQGRVDIILDALIN